MSIHSNLENTDGGINGEEQYRENPVNLEVESFVRDREGSAFEYEDTVTGEMRKAYVFRHRQKLPIQLPEGYGFSGGMARAVVLKEMGENILRPRDYDIVAIPDLDPDLSLRSDLDEKYMGRDAEHGHGISVERIPDYLSTRDFVMNQVLVVGNAVFATPEALRDIKEKVIRPTEYEQDRWYSYSWDTNTLSPKLVMKALRMEVEFTEMYGFGRIEGIHSWQFDTGVVPAFDIALQLDKSFTRGDGMAFRFYTKLIEKGTVKGRDSIEEHPIRANSPEELALSLRWYMGNDHNDPFEFTREGLNMWQDVEDFIREHPRLSDEDLYDYYSDLARDMYPKTRGLRARERYDRGAITSVVDRSKYQEERYDDEEYDDEEEPYIWEHSQENPSAMGIAFRKALRKKQEK